MTSALRHRRVDVLHGIESSGIVAVVRLADAAVVRDVAHALLNGGVRIMEITMTVPRAVEVIAELSGSVQGDVLIGAGTVLDAATATAVIDAGAAFVVSPVLRGDVIEACRRRDVAVMPGCFTPTEILTAWEAGADVVKVFPATALGPQFFKDIRGPLPQIKMMPTGGVSLTNAGEWITAGAVAVGVGTALLDPKAIAESRFEVIAENARTVVGAVAKARSAAAQG